MAIAIAELISVSYFFDFQTALPDALNPILWVKAATQGAFAALVALAILLWPDRTRVMSEWREACGGSSFAVALALNAAAFAALIVATFALSQLVLASSEPPWTAFAFYCALALPVGATIAFLAAPFAFWRWLIIERFGAVAAAVVTGVVAVAASELSQQGWAGLSDATMNASYTLLSLYESDVVVDFAEKGLGAGDFRVLIRQECSGYEGVGLVLAFLSVYLWAMRRELRFPNALLLLPLGAVAVWSFNAVRIAALISIGAHYSPDVAIHGFHSQAGWIGFLFVAIGAMAASRRLAFFSARSEVRRRVEARSEDRLVLALLAPFMALMAASIVDRAFEPHNQWIYPLKALTVAAAIWSFRDVYRDFATRLSPLALAAGAAIGALWVLTEPAADGASHLAVWLEAQPLWIAASWLAMRAAGSIILVPIAEELAFRGYLYRALSARRFDLAPAAFNWLALIASSALFGLIHQRMLAAALAGAVYALLMLRTGRLSDAIAAHMASNAVIFAAALLFAQWSLL